MFLLLALIFFISLLFVVILLFKFVWKEDTRLRNFSLNALLIIFTVLFMFIILEFYFCFFVIKSDGFGFTLSSKKWFSKYWEPINSLGYRDIEHSEEDFINKKTIFVIGDSFIAGHGLKDYEDRFSNLMQVELDNEYVVLNIAKNGWNTPEEYGAILSYPYARPDLIILSYFINDIETAAFKCGIKRPVLIYPPSRTIAPLIDNSYFLNYIYWRLYRFYNTNFGQIYWNYLKKCYFNNKVFELHKKELLRLINYTREQNINVISVVFPNLMAIEASKPFTSPIVDFFKGNNIDCIDLAEMLSGRDPNDIIINNLDGHPNEKLNREIADILLTKINVIEKNSDF